LGPPSLRRLYLNFFRPARVGSTIIIVVFASAVVATVVKVGRVVNDGRRVVVVVAETDDDDSAENDEETEVKICGKTWWAGVCCGSVGVVIAVVNGDVVDVVVFNGVGIGVAVVVLAPDFSMRRAIIFRAGFLVSRDFIRCRRMSGVVLKNEKHQFLDYVGIQRRIKLKKIVIYFL
jgi:hypothetical protein